jgi:O-glycosyl hydrolase
MPRHCAIIISVVCLLFLFAFTIGNNKKKSAIVSHSLVTNNLSEPDTGIETLSIDIEKEFQTIHSFGASDCWSAKFAGKWQDQTKKNIIADLLFSTDVLADGSPKGIGLSLWRFNIGAGSFEQGDASGIKDEYRREECFLNADGKYDWNKQAGAQWFLHAAKKRGVKYLLGFTNSAPVQFTQNNLASGLANTNLSLKEDKYDAFAAFLSQVCKHFNAAGTPFDYISPVNEPQWKWGEHPNQEGSGATNEQISRLIKTLGSKLQADGIKTKITAAEAGQISYLYNGDTNHTGNQVEDFFNPSSINYIGKTPNTEKLISYHSYFSTCPDTMLVKFRQSLNEKRQSIDPSLQLWQSEFGVLGSICGMLNGGPRNTGIDYGLYVAKVMHADLVIAGVSSFQWWLAINPYNYSDGLVFINAPDGSINPSHSKQDGLVSSSKQLWCFGNYSRFIRPGMKRIAASFSGPEDCFVSAYKNADTKQIVTVIINAAANEVKMRLQTSIQLHNKKIESYTTSATQNMRKAIVADADNIVLQSMSVTTLVSSYN